VGAGVDVKLVQAGVWIWCTGRMAVEVLWSNGRGLACKPVAIMIDQAARRFAGVVQHARAWQRVFTGYPWPCAPWRSNIHMKQYGALGRPYLTPCIDTEQRSNQPQPSRLVKSTAHQPSFSHLPALPDGPSSSALLGLMQAACTQTLSA
jgi:hypothetical protein